MPWKIIINDVPGTESYADMPKARAVLTIMINRGLIPDGLPISLRKEAPASTSSEAPVTTSKESPAPNRENSTEIITVYVRRVNHTSVMTAAILIGVILGYLLKSLY